jgi:hypothetical protein
VGDLDGDGLSGTEDPIEEIPRTTTTDKGWRTKDETDTEGREGWTATTTRRRVSEVQGGLVDFGEATETATKVGEGGRITSRGVWILVLVGMSIMGWL